MPSFSLGCASRPRVGIYIYRHGCQLCLPAVTPQYFVRFSTSGRGSHAGPSQGLRYTCPTGTHCAASAAMCTQATEPACPHCTAAGHVCVLNIIAITSFIPSNTMQYNTMHSFCCAAGTIVLHCLTCVSPGPRRHLPSLWIRYLLLL